MKIKKAGIEVLKSLNSNSFIKKELFISLQPRRKNSGEYVEYIK
jgi:hypothetical protein